MKPLQVRLDTSNTDDSLILDKFVERISAICDVLVQTDLIMSENNEKNTEFKITNLSHSSPFTIEISGYPLTSTLDDYSDNVFNEFFSILNDFSKRVPTKEYPTKLVESLRRIGKDIDQKESRISFSMNGKETQVTNEFITNTKAYVIENRTYKGSVKGMLEQINVHGGANNIRIYPIIGAKFVKCSFPTKIKDEVTASIDKYVEVFGILTYKPNEKFASEVAVDSIKVFPNEDELPKLGDLRGINPDITGSLKSEDFIRKQRNSGW